MAAVDRYRIEFLLQPKDDAVRRIVERHFPGFVIASGPRLQVAFDDGPFEVDRLDDKHVEIAVGELSPALRVRPWRLALDLATELSGRVTALGAGGLALFGPASAAIARQARHDWPYLWRVEDVKRAAEDTFPPDSVEIALGALPDGTPARVQLAILKLAHGNASEIPRLVGEAATDVRNILAAAGI
jgi:hypothetical protein